MSAISLMVLPVPTREDFNSKGTERLILTKNAQEKKGEFEKPFKNLFLGWS